MSSGTAPADIGGRLSRLADRQFRYLAITPAVEKAVARRPSVAAAVRTPKFCTWRALTAVPPSAPLSA